MAQCTYPSLAGGTVVTASAPPQPYTLSQSSQYWTAVAVRSAGADNWNIEVDQSQAGAPSCVATPLASSARVTGVDFVVGDFNPGHDPAASYYPLVTRASGSGSATVEWDDGPNALVVNGPLVNRTTGPSDVIEIWDVFLSLGNTYTFTFARTGANARLLLFKSDAGAYWAGRNSAQFEVTTTTTYTPTATGFYGVVVINDDGLAGSYSVGVGTCDTPTALASGTAVSTNGLAETHYSFNQTDAFWTAVGVRGDADWNLECLQNESGGVFPACFSAPLASSALAAPAVDFIVGNFNNQVPTPPFYVRAHMSQDQGSGAAMVEWDNGSTLGDIISVDASLISRTTGPSDVLECWDVFLDAGTNYQFIFRPTGASLKLFLFPAALAWGSRSDAIFQFAGGANPAPFAPGGSGWHGLVVVNENGLAGSYQLGVYSPGVLGTGDEVRPPTRLYAITPNPSRGGIQIAFTLHDAGVVDFEVLDVAGRVVSQTPSRDWPQGRWKAAWGRQGPGGRLSAGVYFLRMRAAGRTVAVRKFALLD